MKALVLSGGRGTRLRPFTHTLAKQLVPVGNKPVLFHVLESMGAVGITDIGIVVGETGNEIRAAVGDGSRFGAAVTYVRQDEPRGLAHAVAAARGFLGEDPFLLHLGDNFIENGVARLLDGFERHGGDAELLLGRVADPRAYGVAERTPLGRVTRLTEKPSAPRSDLAVIGAYAFTAAVHERIDRLTPSRRGELEITDAVQGLVDGGARVWSTEVETFWRDTGSVADVLDVNRHLLGRMEARCAGSVDAESRLIGRVVVEEGAEVTSSRLVGPLLVGRNSRVAGAFIGPHTSIGEDCAVVDSGIDHSIVLDRAVVEGAGRITDSLIGRDSRVTGTGARQGHRVVIGDHSTVGIPA
ncbi:glucose-1-phosphate thymidylyltransferase [Streptomyces sp. PT12]|uniref:glucose-1-phosphate thymidylyltransferase n=1 Tax=Streptomyces sp. PT12 TaxID=1510197 RepID=UPI000DE3D0B5|nr:glucose-1-phosphate thymidylyltransferase [Streptomyces sp. PT12]RBM12318.1 glucose-1-phosphate thymidylyltransferase [Streptomyces sp. PT12]